MAENPGATFAIGELAARFDLRTNVLRHWESVGLLTPAERVSGRRRYNRGHVARIAMILRLKHVGFGLSQIREVLDAADDRTRREHMLQHKQELDRRIAELQAAKQMVDHMVECRATDTMQCPTLQRIVAELEEQLPQNPLHGGGSMTQWSVDHPPRPATAK